MKLSLLAESISTSPILTIAAQINAKKAQGEHIYNMTVGDFDSNIYPIPDLLKVETIKAYDNNQTNYPGALGVLEFREGVAETLNRLCGLHIEANEVQIASGSRPLLYATYQILVDPGDTVVFPVPSWNNDYYSLMSKANIVTVETQAENDFMPTANELAPHLKGATLLALCSPQNPTGTVFSRQGVKDICALVIEENQRRSESEKPLYVLFDQVYWLLTFGNADFTHPLSVCPAIKEYAVFIDGLSKSFAGTGIRVGWATAPAHIMPKITALTAHIGAWAPKPEQVAAGVFLKDYTAVDHYLVKFRTTLETRLHEFYKGFMALKEQGFAVDAIAPQAAIYLSVKIDLVGKTTSTGEILNNTAAVHGYLLNTAKVGILPFSWFGAKNSGDWFRLSIGTCEARDITRVIEALKRSMSVLV